MKRKLGLARVISKLGYCSRAQAMVLIRADRVRVNGLVRRDVEAPINTEKDRIEVDGELLEKTESIYLMLNKPRGIVTTASDEKGRDTVYSLLPKGMPWLAPVGRLDKASEGLLLMTNDSEWAAGVTDPATHIEKTYHVQINGIMNEKHLNALHHGIRTETGDVLRVKQVRELRRGVKNMWLEVVLDEGKNRHIRRMLQATNIGVLRLVRVAIGPLEIGKLAKGMARELTHAEKKSLDSDMNP